MKIPVCLLMLLICHFSYCYEQSYRFFNVNNGLSSSRINSIRQDHEGYVWIATEDGLNRFDGNQFTVYRNIPTDSTSLPNNSVKQVLEDSRHRLWITTMAGLCQYDRKTNSFISFRLFSEMQEELLGQVGYITEDRNNNIWISISSQGVMCMNLSQNTYTHYNTRNSLICSDHINCIFEDNAGIIWLGTEHGLCTYSPATKTFQTHYLDPEHKIPYTKISSICEDAEGNLWIGTLTEGVFIFSQNRKTFRRLKENPQTGEKEICSLLKDRKNNIWISNFDNGLQVYSAQTKETVNLSLNIPEVNLAEGTIHALFEDRQGNIWAGLFQKGLLMLSSQQQIFKNYQYNPFSKESIADGAIVPVYCDSHGEIWLGKDGGGFFRLDKNKKIIDYFRSEKGNPENIIISMFEDSNGDIWIGTYLSGVMRFNRGKNKIDLRLTPGLPPYHLSAPHITSFVETADKRLWIATNGGGIDIYDPVKNTFEYIQKKDTSDNQLIDNWCNVLYLDSDSLLWIGTYNGLCTYDIHEKQFVTYYDQQLPGKIVHSLQEDIYGNMWVGTQNGLARISKMSATIETYGIKEGLPNSLIHDIKRDNEGNMWLTTGNGLSMLDIQTKNFENYTTDNGLATGECNQKSFDMTPDGEFIFGTTRGFTSFFPTERKQIGEEPLNLMFNELFIHNQLVKVSSEEDGFLKQTLNSTDLLTFNAEQNSFTISFSAIEFLLPQNVHYEVYLEGFDKQWQPVKNKMVTYTNLNPDNYTLHIKAWENDKNGALQKELRIRILPPVWLTLWAKCLYIVLFLSICIVVYRYIKEKENEKKQKKMLQEKLQFFTDISHEIRTPLTLIMTPLGKLISQNTNSTLLPTYNMMYKHANRLLLLVNQILDLRSLEFNKKRLKVEECNITQFIGDLKESFSNWAEEKGLAFTFQSIPETITGYIDTDILSKILFNLISNAIKYTDAGEVKIDLSLTGKGQLCIKVSDTGKGIAKEMQQKIFERFFMVNAGNTNKTISYGIGLHLTNKIVQLHHGSIQIESEIGKGSIFTITLPIQSGAYAPAEILKNKRDKDSLQMASTYSPESVTLPPKKKKASGHSPKILVVEDNVDIRQLINGEFSDEYQIIEAENGKEGLRLALDILPDLIVSDVLMPEMDGIELCKKIRNNESTRLVPFIMLTARSSIRLQTEGIQVGADAYVPKPFDLDYLRALVNRLLQKSALINQQASTVKESTTSADTSPEDKMLIKINSIIDSHIDNPELSVDLLCKELCLSRTHLNRKIKELTGESPASYIKQIRLRKATSLLMNRSLSISEIAFMTGFSSPSYFSQAFREYYGVTPKEYINYNSM